MLTKHAKRILKQIEASKKRQFTLDSLKQICGSSDALDLEYTLRHLEANGFLEITYGELEGRGHQVFIRTVGLTEEGAHYREVLRRRRLDYLADKWVDIVALTVSIVSLLLAAWPWLSAAVQRS